MTLLRMLPGFSIENVCVVCGNILKKFWLPFYYLLVLLLRQDCKKVWALLECLELWTKLEEPQGFVICALLLGTSSDATPHVTMNIRMMHTYSFSRKLACHYIITIGHSSLDSAIPDKLLEIPSYMLAFGEMD